MTSGQEFDVNRNLAKQKGIHPLYLFSLYTGLQHDALNWLASEIDGIRSSIDFKGKSIDAQALSRYYNSFWFWTLGAYEVVRTMSQHKACFSDAVAAKTVETKKLLSVIRIPFAKQEIAQRGGPVWAELSICGFSEDDFKLQIADMEISPSKVISQVLSFLEGISHDDILASIPRSAAERSSLQDEP